MWHLNWPIRCGRRLRRQTHHQMLPKTSSFQKILMIIRILHGTSLRFSRMHPMTTHSTRPCRFSHRRISSLVWRKSTELFQTAYQVCPSLSHMCFKLKIVRFCNRPCLRGPYGSVEVPHHWAREYSLWRCTFCDRLDARLEFPSKPTHRSLLELDQW